MYKWVSWCIFSLLILSCEDVIEVDTPSDEPRLIVNAVMRVDTTDAFLPIEVSVSLSDNFFEGIGDTSVESMVIISSLLDDYGLPTNSGTSILGEVSPNSGVYVPLPGEEIPMSAIEADILYTLVIEYQGKRYAGQTQYVPSVPIGNLEIGTETLFDDDETELIVTFTDDPDRDNFYLFDFGFDEFLVTEDEFYKGQEFSFSYFYDQQFESGTQLEVSILGADQNFYNYMDQLIEQSEEVQGPFQTPVATVRGNMFDVTGLDNIEIVDNTDRPDEFPLGYFAIVQEYKSTITVQ